MAEASSNDNIGDDTKTTELLPEDEIATSHSCPSLNIRYVDHHPECSVCLQPCLQPVQLPCEHVFCFLCVKGFAYRSRKCALCRREVSLEYFENPLVVKVREKSTKVSATTESGEKSRQAECFDWYYEGRNGWWQYDKRASHVLEDAFKSESRSCELLVAGFSYLVDFSNMIQFRKSNPARCRRVKRDKVNADKKGIAGLKLASLEGCDEEKIENRLKSLKDYPSCVVPPNNTSDHVNVQHADLTQTTENEQETECSQLESVVEEIQTRLNRVLSHQDEES